MDDALRDAPKLAIVLTTRDPHTTPAEFRRATKTLWQALRRAAAARGGTADYFGRIEFTTGEGPRSGGWRRIHVHYVVKLRGCESGSWVFELVQDTWRASTGAWRVQVEELRTQVGALHYLWLDQAKVTQLPPKEWRGMVDRASQGYFSEPVGVLRERADRGLWAERLAFSTGLDLGDAEFMVEQTVALAAERREEDRRLRVALREVLPGLRETAPQAPVDAEGADRLLTERLPGVPW
jgi:hypothetical protein